MYELDKVATVKSFLENVEKRISIEEKLKKMVTDFENNRARTLYYESHFKLMPDGYFFS